VSANVTFNRALAALVLPLALTACDPQEWITDMRQQPSVNTWQEFAMDSTGLTTPFRGNPQGSVPVTGVTVAAWEVSYAPMINTVDSLSRVPNPVAVDSRSLENGHRLYSVNCAVCHGEIGDGNGGMRRLNAMYGFAPAINGAATAARTDGYLWGMMRNGRGLMPSFNRISDRERWDVVNYIRGLQGRYGVRLGTYTWAGSASAFSGVSAIAPTMPSMHVKPSTAGMVPKAEAPAGAAPHSGGH
jgi:mono/diheme cytochrome c family protein